MMDFFYVLFFRDLNSKKNYKDALQSKVLISTGKNIKRTDHDIIFYFLIDLILDS